MTHLQLNEGENVDGHVVHLQLPSPCVVARWAWLGVLVGIYLKGPHSPKSQERLFPLVDAANDNVGISY